MRRVFWVSAVVVMLVEALLGLAFWAGYVWLGGLVPGLLLAAAVLILLILPWVGEVRLAYDSQAQEVRVKVSWWASALVRLSGERELRVRLLGLPLRRQQLAKPQAPTPAPPAEVDLVGWARRNLCDLMRLALAALQGTNEIARGTKQLTVIANAPTRYDVLDQVIAGAVGTRSAGPVTLQVRPEGPHRVQIRYCVGLCTLLSAGLFVLIQGRARKLSRSLKAARKGR